MSIETIILLSLSVLLFSVRRVLSGIGNAIFYAKGTAYAKHKKLKGFIENIHSLETPQWYSHAGGHFFAYLIVFRELITSEAFLPSWLIPIGLSILLVMAGSALASPFYQGYINISNGRDWIDKKESRSSEFNLFGIIRFHWPRPFTGWARYLVMIFGLVYLIAAFMIIRLF